MREYKFLFKRIMLYIMRHNSNEDYLKQHKDIVKIFSCDEELVLKVMELYYGDEIYELIEMEICNALKWSPNLWINSYVSHLSTIPTNLFNNCGDTMTGNLRIPDNIPTVNRNFNI